MESKLEKWLVKPYILTVYKNPHKEFYFFVNFSSIWGFKSTVQALYFGQKLERVHKPQMALKMPIVTRG